MGVLDIEVSTFRLSNQFCSFPSFLQFCVKKRNVCSDEFATYLKLNFGKYVACSKSPVTHTFYSERIAGTNNSYSCRIIGHFGTYFTVQNDTHFNDLTATVTLVTISRNDRSKSNYANCFRNFHFSQSAKLINQGIM